MPRQTKGFHTMKAVNSNIIQHNKTLSCISSSKSLKNMQSNSRQPAKLFLKGDIKQSFSFNED